MLRIIRDNTPETGLKLFGINFGDPIKKDAMATLQQWERLEKENANFVVHSKTRIRYPIRKEMEIPRMISFIVCSGQPIKTLIVRHNNKNL